MSAIKASVCTCNINVVEIAIKKINKKILEKNLERLSKLVPSSIFY